MRLWSPATAMLWESWRLTWRQVVFFGALSTFSGWGLLAGASDPNRGYGVLMVLLCVAIMALASMCLVAGRATLGFPYPLAFGRPVRTALLVAVPMLYRAAACGALYAIPATALRATYGVPFPVAPIAALLAASAMLFLASMWFTRDARIRSFMTIATLFFGVPAALGWLDPWNAEGGAFPPPVTAEMVQLSGADYLLIVLAVAAVYVVTVAGVELQRHGHGESRAPQSVATPRKNAAAKGFVERFRDVALAVVQWQCPTSSPLAAELWIETKARALPVLALGLLLAVCAPLLVALGANVEAALVGVFIVTVALVMPGLPFFAAIAASFWDRDASLRTPMNAFEATRPIATARLAAVRIAVAVGAILGAWTLIAVGLWLSARLGAAGTPAGTLPETLVGALRGLPVGRLAGVATLMLVAFSTVVALLAAVGAFAAIYGKRLWLGALGLALYGVFALFALVTELWSDAVVGAHLWIVAAAIPAGTVFVMVRTVAERIMRPRHAAATVAVWATFMVIGWLVARDLGLTLDALRPAVVALVFAAALLPLTASMLAVWSLGLIRHA